MFTSEAFGLPFAKSILSAVIAFTAVFSPYVDIGPGHDRRS